MNHELRIKNTYAFLLAGLITAPMAWASNDDDHDTQRQHDAHNHGHATLSIVQEGNNIQLMLESPAANIVGFEYSPTTQQEKQQIDKAVEILRQGDQLFTFSPNAQCVQTTVEIESELTELSTHHDEQEESDHKSHEDEQEGHSDFAINYLFSCDDPSSLKVLNLQLFKFFPLTKEIDAQVVTDQRQFAAELSAQQPSINF